jgi:putative aldouronate transport system permease protein
VTLPGLRSITILLFILQLGNLLSVGFEQIFLQVPLVGQDAGNVISTYVYYQGVVDGNISYGTAAGFMQAIVAAGLIWGANRVAKALGEDGLF